MQIITSKDNEIVKDIKKLKEKKYREQESKFIVEGIKMVEEAIDEKIKIDKIVVCEDCVNDNSIEQELMYKIAKNDCIYVTKKVFLTMTDVVNPQGILAVIDRRDLEKTISYNEDIILVLDGIQDPGNLGTILRTLDSVGLSQIVLSENTADPYNSKVVRATMGAIYRVNIIEVEDIIEILKKIKKNNYNIVATSLETNNNIYNIDYKKKAIIIGNEANGVSQKILEIVDEKIKIPMLGKTESLNVAVATGVILYEYARRKM